MDCTGPKATGCTSTDKRSSRGAETRHTEGPAGTAPATSASMKEAPYSVQHLDLDSHSLQEEGMQTRACRSAVRRQCTTLPRDQLQCQDAWQAVTDSPATPARGARRRPQSET